MHGFAMFQLAYMVSSGYAQHMCRVRFNNLVWDVYGVSAADPKLETGEGPAYGMTYFDSCEIYIRSDRITPELLMRVCRHEAAHAAAFSYAFDTESLSEEDLCNFVEAYGEEICRTARKMYRAIMADR